MISFQEKAPIQLQEIRMSIIVHDIDVMIMIKAKRVIIKRKTILNQNRAFIVGDDNM